VQAMAPRSLPEASKEIPGRTISELIALTQSERAERHLEATFRNTIAIEVAPFTRGDATAERKPEADRQAPALVV